MKRYTLLKLFGILSLLGGVLLALLALVPIALGALNLFAPYSVSLGITPSEFRFAAAMQIGQGIGLFIAAFISISISQLVDMLFEIRTRVSGTQGA